MLFLKAQPAKNSTQHTKEELIARAVEDVSSRIYGILRRENQKLANEDFSLPEDDMLFSLVGQALTPRLAPEEQRKDIQDRLTDLLPDFWNMTQQSAHAHAKYELDYDAVRLQWFALENDREKAFNEVMHYYREIRGENAIDYLDKMLNAAKK